MSRRRYPLRSAAVASRSLTICPEYISSDSSDASDASDDKDFDLFETLIDLYQSRSMPRPRKRKRTKNSASTQECTSGTTSQGRGGTSRGRGARARRRVARNKGSRMPISQSLTSTQVGCSGRLTSLDWESDNEIIEEDVKSSHQKDIENKVDKFFKSGNLISDDEDDLNLVKTTEKQAPKEPKEFYLLSDSDDEQPAKKNDPTGVKTELTGSQSNPVEIISSNSTSDKDELMDIVDKILDCDDVPLEVDTLPDMSWTEYKSKREEILGSVKALLGELEEPLEDKEQKVVQISPEKSKPSCPICLEILGGNVVAASTMCGHIFCQDCIKKVAKSTKICPTCRKRINLKQIHPLYL